MDVISAQGGTSDAYALLELIPAKDIAILVLANSHSRLVSGLERRILSSLVPGVSSEEQPNNSQSIAAVPSFPHAVREYRSRMNVIVLAVVRLPVSQEKTNFVSAHMPT